MRQRPKLWALVETSTEEQLKTSRNEKDISMEKFSELNSLDFSELEVKTPEIELPEATEICGSSMSISENPNFSGKKKL